MLLHVRYDILFWFLLYGGRRPHWHAVPSTLNTCKLFLITSLSLTPNACKKTKYLRPKIYHICFFLIWYSEVRSIPFSFIKTFTFFRIKTFKVWHWPFDQKNCTFWRGYFFHSNNHNEVKICETSVTTRNSFVMIR